MKKSFKLLIYSIVIALLIFFISKIQIRNTIHTLFSLDPIYLLSYVLVIFLLFVFITYRWIFLLNVHSKNRINLPFITFFKYRIISYAVSYITPFALIGGEPVRAWLVRKQLPLPKALSATMIDKLLDIILNLVILIFAFFVILIKFSFIGYSILITFLVLGFFGIFLILFFILRFTAGKTAILLIARFFRVHKIKFFEKHINLLKNMENELIEFFTKKKKTLIISFIYTAIAAILMYFEYLTLLDSMHIFEISFFIPIILLTVIGFSFIIPVPAGAGTMELFIISLFMAIGLDPGKGLALALIVRLKDIVIAIIGIFLLLKTDFDFNKFKRINDKDGQIDFAIRGDKDLQKADES